MASFQGKPGTRRVKPISIILKQEMTGGGSGIIWTICKSFAPRSRQTTTPAPHHQFFTGEMPFLMPNQQRQSTRQQDVDLLVCQHQLQSSRMWTLLNKLLQFIHSQSQLQKLLIYVCVHMTVHNYCTQYSTEQF